jgi:ribosome production factor 1
MREFDPSIITANPSLPPKDAEVKDTTEGDIKPEEEVNVDMENDPFAGYFNSEADPTIPPKVLITTSLQASKATYSFCDELVGIFPDAEFIRRKKGKGFEMGTIAGWAAGRQYGAMVVVNEDKKKPSK